jgi:hypothetical protein
LAALVLLTTLAGTVAFLQRRATQVVRVKGKPSAALPLRTVAVLSNPLRYARGDKSKAPRPSMT